MCFSWELVRFEAPFDYSNKCDARQKNYVLYSMYLYGIMEHSPSDAVGSVMALSQAEYSIYISRSGHTLINISCPQL